MHLCIITVGNLPLMDRTGDFFQICNVMVRHNLVQQHHQNITSYTYTKTVSRTHSFDQKIRQLVYLMKQMENLFEMQALYGTVKHDINRLFPKLNALLRDIQKEFNSIQFQRHCSKTIHLHYSIIIAHLVSMRKHISELYIPFTLSTETNTIDTIPCNRNGNNNAHAQQLLTDARKAKQNEYKKIENTIIDIGCSLIKMNTIIKQQDEVINLIDDNIADTLNNVEKGRFQLYKYLDALTNQRTFYAKLFLILLVAIVIQIYTNTPYS